jgi:hypothetical protein
VLKRTRRGNLAKRALLKQFVNPVYILPTDGHRIADGVVMLTVILLVFAFVLAVVAGVLAPAPPVNPWSWRMLCWALACWFLAEILAKGGSVLRLG